MEVLASIDIEDAMQEVFNGLGIASCAPPVPSDIGSTLPHVMPWALGSGYRMNLVQDLFSLSIDVRAETHEEAARLAGTVCGIVRALKGRMVGGVQCYGGEIDREPYPNPDPEHPNIPRYTVGAQVVCRAAPRELPDWPE